MTQTSEHTSALVASPSGSDQRGFSLVEAVVATAIAVIAVIGLAFSFGMGRAMISRFEVGRVAMGIAEARMESFAALPPAQIIAPAADSVAFSYKGLNLGFESWDIQPTDDSFDGVGGADADGLLDFKRITVRVRWQQGTDGNVIELTRLFPGT